MIKGPMQNFPNSLLRRNSFGSCCKALMKLKVSFAVAYHCPTYTDTKTHTHACALTHVHTHTHTHTHVNTHKVNTDIHTQV